uniref:Uncharacterized protein n=1 Tax=Siphoviridae sp. ctDyb2 TaxID=2826201 RepID=A0A8S5MCJ8_9CAUD|nr:MAG TPA: hypothetical protein [Siphoviridae sp. ctDyb2]
MSECKCICYLALWFALCPRSLGPARWRRLALEIANGGSLELPPLTLLTCAYLCVSDVTLAR